MKLSELIQKLFKASEFTSPNSLAEYTKQTQPFTDAFLNGTKESRKKEDLIFEELTKGLTVKELMAAIELIKQVKAAQIEREQFL